MRIAQDKPGAARRRVETLRRQAQRAAEFPKSGRKVPQFDREDLREILVNGYRIVYALRGEGHRLLRLSEEEP